MAMEFHNPHVPLPWATAVFQIPMVSRHLSDAFFAFSNCLGFTDGSTHHLTTMGADYFFLRQLETS